jgi:glycosyltransferase involved in cell wall biosynthesis
MNVRKHALITIITPSFNQGQYIDETIKSVLNQNWKWVQHIIIDGGSTDNTLEILAQYPHLKWVSGKDDGQSDALNKGLAMADGDIIGWLNSDDYYNENIFKDVVSHFQEPDVQWIIGDSNDYHVALNQYRKVKSPKISYDFLLENSESPRQPPTFFRKTILNQVNGFDKSFDFVMDYDLWIRLSKISEPRMVGSYYANFRIHSDQKTKTRANLLGFIREIDAVLKREKVSFINRKKTLFRRYKGYVKLLAKTLLVRIHLMDKKYLTMNYSSRKWLSD